MYLFFNGIVYKSKKNRIAEIVCIVLAFINGLILGGRGDGIQLIASGVIIYLLLRRGKYGSVSFRLGNRKAFIRRNKDVLFLVPKIIRNGLHEVTSYPENSIL